MSLFGFGAPKRRRRKRASVFFNEAKFSGVDAALTIGALGAVGFGLYFLFKSGRGVDEGLKTAGDWAKNFVDAVNSTGEWIGSGSKGMQDWFYQVEKGRQDAIKGMQDWFHGIEKGRQDAIESTWNAGCWAQKLFDPSKQCTDLNKRDLYVLKKIMTGGSTKPVPKITNQVRYNMLRIGVNPYQL